MFLDKKISKEKEVTAASVKVLRDIIEQILESCEAANQEELIEKKKVLFENQV